MSYIPLTFFHSQFIMLWSHFLRIENTVDRAGKKWKNNETRLKLDIVEITQIKIRVSSQKLTTQRDNISTRHELKETTFSGSIREKNNIMYEHIIYSEFFIYYLLYFHAQHPPRSSKLNLHIFKTNAGLGTWCTQWTHAENIL